METPPPDWDLLAVVRSCSTTSTTTSTVVPMADLPPPLFDFHNVNPAIPSPCQELHDICNPMTCSTTACTSSTVSSYQPSVSVSVSVSSPFLPSASSIPSSFGLSMQQEGRRRMMKPTHVVFGGSHSSTTQGQRKKRKNLMKKVCHVPAEGLSNDMWAWRKYGQKPIKGSPYPRGYYRCSSSKGCLARKQVERNRTDPKMFIVTYTSEHNHPMPTHRNSLAGSSRQKPTATTPTTTTSTTTSTTTTTPENNPTCSSSPSDNSLTETKTDNGDQMGISELMLEDDFYVKFEQIDGDSNGFSDHFSDHFSTSVESPWLVDRTGGVTAAGVGGG